VIDEDEDDGAVETEEQKLNLMNSDEDKDLSGHESSNP
jgi:hypothetical protein